MSYDTTVHDAMDPPSPRIPTARSANKQPPDSPKGGPRKRLFITGALVLIIVATWVVVAFAF